MGAGAEHDRTTQFKLLREAVAKEDSLFYDEPPAWFFPVRHVLGAELLAAGKASEAELVYREDLKRNPDNGWALYGLMQPLKAQAKHAEAAAAAEKFKAAWTRADIVLTGSAL